jgi:hypothetical protein
MNCATFTIAAIAFLCGTTATGPLVTYESPCECRDNHGKHRWAEKNDPALPPAEASAIQAVTPSDIFSWQGPTEYLVPSSERIWSEQKWYALTGRVVDLRAEEDGDLHIALQDATGDKPAIFVVEIPAKPQWCELRKIVFWLDGSPVSVSRPVRKKTKDRPTTHYHSDRQGVLRHRPRSGRSYDEGEGV